MKPLKRASLFVIAGGLVALVAAGAALPWILTRFVNRRLASVREYEGSVEQIGVHWATGQLTASRVRFNKRDQTPPAVFLSVDKIVVDLSVRHLLRGRTVINVAFEKPLLTVLIRQRKRGEPRKFGLWQPFFATFPPFLVDRWTLQNGSVTLQNTQVIPPTVFAFDRIDLVATNMANRKNFRGPGPTRVEGKGFLGPSPVWISIEAEPFQEHATFHFKGGLTNFNLVALNDLLHFYTNMNLNHGFFSLNADVVAKDGEFGGHINRTLTDIDVRHAHKGLMKNMKEALFQTWINWQQGKTRHIETDFQLTGPLGYMDKDLFLASTWVATRSFLHSLKPTLPRELRLSTPEEAQDKWMEVQARARKKLDAKTAEAKNP